jgi:nucleoporin POM34
MLAVRIILLYSICLQFWPLFKPKDDLADIPLTPSQRAAMGLDPSIMNPQTPEGSYVTPPRYSRSTPRSSLSNNSARRLSQSPLSGSPIGGSPRAGSNSPFSPNASPLLQKAFGGGAGARRLTFDRQSPLTNSYFGESSASNTPSTPTPAPNPAPAKASVGLNNKWLYEKGRGSPGRSLFT